MIAQYEEYIYNKISATKANFVPKNTYLEGWSLPFGIKPGKTKDKVAHVSDSNKNIQSSCMHKLRLTELKYMLSISGEKLAKGESYSAVGTSQI